MRALGLSADEIQYRADVGRLHRKYKNVYAAGRPDLTLDGVFLAAVRACGPDAKLSCGSALRKWGLWRGGTYRIDVTAPRSIKPKPGIRLHRPLSLGALDTTVYSQRAGGGGAVFVPVVLGAGARDERLGLGQGEAGRGRLSLARCRPDRRDRQCAVPRDAVAPSPGCGEDRGPPRLRLDRPALRDVEVNGTPAQVAATVLAAMRGPPEPE
jgi:hypothetical protein